MILTQKSQAISQLNDTHYLTFVYLTAFLREVLANAERNNAVLSELGTSLQFAWVENGFAVCMCGNGFAVCSLCLQFEEYGVTVGGKGHEGVERVVMNIQFAVCSL